MKKAAIMLYPLFSGSLGKLGKIDHIVLFPLLININRGFRTHKTNIGFPGKYSSHRFICSQSVDQLDVQPFFFKIAFF